MTSSVSYTKNNWIATKRCFLFKVIHILLCLVWLAFILFLTFNRGCTLNLILLLIFYENNVNFSPVYHGPLYWEGVSLAWIMAHRKSDKKDYFWRSLKTFRSAFNFFPSIFFSNGRRESSFWPWGNFWRRRRNERSWNKRVITSSKL